MKKHILGLAIFSLIIGVSVFFYGLFKMQLTTCRFKSVDYREIEETGINNNPNIIKQAVFNQNKNTFYFDLGKLDSDAGIVFHFYAKNNNNVRYLKGIVTQYKPQIEIINKQKGMIDLENPNNPLINVSANENLYVIPVLIYDGSTTLNNVPKFDHNSAVAVLKDFGN